MSRRRWGRGPPSCGWCPGWTRRRSARCPGRRREVRERHGLGDRRVVLCVSRLVARKGQDTLVRALPGILRAVPDAVLVIVGHGPDEERLRRLARRHAEGHVVFAGGLDHASTAPYYAAADVFAMPCRTRKAGLEAEGLGIVFLEAAASGLPVVAGDSGGAPDAVVDGVTGTVVDGTDVRAVAGAVSGLLGDPERAAAMGEGRPGVGGRAMVLGLVGGAADAVAHPGCRPAGRRVGRAGDGGLTIRRLPHGGADGGG